VSAIPPLDPTDLLTLFLHSFRQPLISHGADLNRNFPDPVLDRGSDLRKATAATEPEVAQIMDFILSRTWSASANLHEGSVVRWARQRGVPSVKFVTLGLAGWIMLSCKRGLRHTWGLEYEEALLKPVYYTPAVLRAHRTSTPGIKLITRQPNHRPPTFPTAAKGGQLPLRWLHQPRPLRYRPPDA
jgi:hypothetical protein